MERVRKLCCWTRLASSSRVASPARFCSDCCLLFACSLSVSPRTVILIPSSLFRDQDLLAVRVYATVLVLTPTLQLRHLVCRVLYLLYSSYLTTPLYNTPPHFCVLVYPSVSDSSLAPASSSLSTGKACSPQTRRDLLSRPYAHRTDLPHFVELTASRPRPNSALHSEWGWGARDRAHPRGRRSSRTAAIVTTRARVLLLELAGGYYWCSS